jgi:hypothetical protein
MDEARVDVLVPAGRCGLGIAPRSAVVGRRLPGGGWVADYEGGTHRGEPWAFHDRMRVAAGRAWAECPTVARGLVQEGEAAVVATYDARQLRFVEVLDPGALVAWSGEALDEVVGVVVPPGPVEVGRLEALRLAPSRVTGTSMWTLTRAGQVVRYDLPTRSAVVYDRDDPTLPADVRERYRGAP